MLLDIRNKLSLVSFKLWLLNVVIIISALIGVVAAYEQKKGAELHRLNIKHLKYNEQLCDSLDQFRSGEQHDVNVLKQSLLKIRQQSQGCLNEIGWAEAQFMRYASTELAVNICRHDVAAVNIALQTLENYQDGTISKEVMLSRLEGAKNTFNENSARLYPLIDQTVGSLFAFVIVIVIGKAIILVLLGAYLSHRVSRDYNELKSTQQFSKLVLESNPDLIYIKNRQFETVSANKAFLDIHSQRQSEKPSELAQIEQHAFEKGHIEHTEEVLLKNGAIKTFDTKKIRFEDHKHEPFILSVGRDITEQEKNQKNVKRLFKTTTMTGDVFFNALVKNLALSLEASHAFIAKLDKKDEMRTIAYWGQEGMVENISYSLSNTPCQQVMDKELFFCYENVCQQFPQNSYLEDINTQSYIGMSLKDNSNKAIGILCCVSDSPIEIGKNEIYLLRIFAARAVAEIERNENVKQMEKTISALTSSNASLERFAHAVSHDLREPLRGISSCTQLIKDYYDKMKPEQKEELVEAILTGTERMRALIDNLLQYAVLGNKVTYNEPLQCEVILQYALKNLSYSIHKSSASITCDALPNVMGEKIHLVQLFQNIISNAIEYRADATPAIHVSAKQQDKKWWVISVKDNGKGIEQEFHDDVFVMFKRLEARSNDSGTGIGLAMCRRIVENHGGKIWLESKAGCGSTFYFSLPSVA